MEKISLFLPFAFLLLPLIAFSQKDSNRAKPFASISIDAGVGAPTSVFGSYYDTYKGYAKIGPFISVSATVPIPRTLLGIAGIIGYESNSYDTTSYFENGTFSFSTIGSYKMYIAMPGLCVIIPGTKADFEFRLLIGELYFKAPFLKEYVHKNGGLLSATIRLHQVKYFEKTGVPPIDKGMLMFYNMGKINSWNYKKQAICLGKEK